MVQCLGLYAANARGPAWIPGWGTGSHMPQLGVRIKLKILDTTTETAQPKKKKIHPYLLASSVTEVEQQGSRLASLVMEPPLVLSLKIPIALL